MKFPLTTRCSIFNIFLLFCMPGMFIRASWENHVGYESNITGEKTLFWSSVQDTTYEAGIYHNGVLNRLYGEINYEKSLFCISAGQWSKTFLNGFILSHGEYFPGGVSTPDQRPVGFSIKYDSSWFSYFTGYYSIMNQEAVLQQSVSESMQLHSFVINYTPFPFSFHGGISLSTTNQILDINQTYSEKFIENIYPALYVMMQYKKMLILQGELSEKYGWFVAMLLKAENVSLDILLMNVKPGNSFRAGLYQENRHYYVTLSHQNLKIKIYDTDNKLHAKAIWVTHNFWFYNYINNKNILFGIYYYSSQQGLSPYGAIYMTPNSSVIINSLGINYNDQWMFALVHSRNISKKFYPADEMLIPARFYINGLALDSVTSYNRSYFGFQFYWDHDPLFLYASVLQNYAETLDDSITVSFRLAYTKKF